METLFKILMFIMCALFAVFIIVVVLGLAIGASHIVVGFINELKQVGIV